MYGPLDDLRHLASERCAALAVTPSELRSIWMATRFLIDFDASAVPLEKFCSEDKASIWDIRDIAFELRDERRTPLSLRQLEFVITQFARAWPPVSPPAGGHWGDQHSWNATQFLRRAIDAIGADNSRAASDALDRLLSDSDVGDYRDHIKHVRARQLRLRRDTEYRVPSIAEVKTLLSGGLPGTIDDLKAVALDALERVQTYLRFGDTQAWEALWASDEPKDENTCRDRILDNMRRYVPGAIALMPETRMPEAKRADIVAIYNGNGVPMEFKGQWHSDVWDASSVQLIEQYTKDWRADGRGIYVALWFGDVARKNIPKHPGGQPRPRTPDEFRRMLIERIDSSERARVDVVIIDVSKPVRTH